MDRRDFQQLSRLRLREARALLRLRLADGAYYAVECALKACIAKRTQRHEFPDKRRAESSHSHNLAQLLNESGIKQTFAEKAGEDAQFKKYWDFVQLWSEQSRYEAHALEEAEAFLRAINDRNHGVLACIRRHW